MQPFDGALATFVLDVKYIELVDDLQALGIRPVLIKGPAFDRLLYGGRRIRAYSDIDVLIDPDRLSAAERALVANGFRRFESESTARQTDPEIGISVGVLGASHATPWIRESDNFIVDIHDSLPQLGAPPARVWQTLTRHVASITIAGFSLETLDRVASALLICLHAAHHGPGWRSSADDMEQALQLLDFACWRAAADLARQLGAELPMGIGLGLNEQGRILALQLGLSPDPTAAYRLMWDGAAWMPIVLAAVIAERSLRARAALLKRILLPTPASMRRGSQVARHGPLGLIAAYLNRVFQLLISVPSVIGSARRS
jgi:hypothetical protein